MGVLEGHPVHLTSELSLQPGNGLILSISNELCSERLGRRRPVGEWRNDRMEDRVEAEAFVVAFGGDMERKPL